MSTTKKSERALIVVSQLTTGVPDDHRWLYRFIEASGRVLVKTILENDYVDCIELYDTSATPKKLIEALEKSGKKSSIEEIDLIIMLHGATNSLVFHDGSIDTSELKTEILNLDIKKKLRMVYSLACYGDSHSDDFVSAGFNSAIGAVGINANAAAEFPTFLQCWSMNFRLRDALAMAESPVTRLPADEAARQYAIANHLSWANKVNSDKIIRGNQSIRIRSDV